MRNRILWIMQWVLGLYYISVGIVHFVLPDGLPQQMDWMYVLSDTLHVVSGTAEILGGLGLILPAVTKIKPQLVPLAAAGLALTMVLAAGWHLTRSEIPNVIQDLFLAALLGFLAYGRWRLEPLPERGSIQPAV